MAAVTTLTGMSRSAGRKCRDLGPGTTESGHPMLMAHLPPPRCCLSARLQPALKRPVRPSELRRHLNHQVRHFLVRRR